MFVFLSKLDKLDKIVLLIGFLVTIKIRIIGIFSAAEIILISMFVLRFNGNLKLNVYVKRLWWFAVAWLAGAIVSNIYNDVNRLEFIKGVFFLIILIVIIPPIYRLLFDKPERLVLFFLGYGFGQILAPYTTNDEELAEALSSDVYVYYGILAVVSGVAYYLYFKGYKTISLILRYGIAVYGLFNMARNPFMTSTIAMLLLFVIRRESKKSLLEAMADFKHRIPVYFIFAFVAIYLADNIYEPLAANGTLGEEAQYKYFKQRYSGGNALEGGRVETFMGIELIKRNPIWGYGSYARDTNDTFHAQYAVEHDLEYIWTGDSERLLPGHSHIVGSWVQNGIMGGVFWLYVLFMCWRIFKSGCILCEQRILCLLMFQSCAFLWDLLFSPFGDRTFTMFFIIALFVIYDHSQKGYYQLGKIQKLNI